MKKIEVNSACLWWLSPWTNKRVYWYFYEQIYSIKMLTICLGNDEYMTRFIIHVPWNTCLITVIWAVNGSTSYKYMYKHWGNISVQFGFCSTMGLDYSMW